MWIERADQSLIARWWWTVDRWTLGAVMVLITFGTFIVASASIPEALRNGLDPYYYFRRHAVYALLAMATVFIVSLFPRARLPRLGVAVYLCAIALVASTLVVGTTLNGAKRWISLGIVSLQPSEFLKPAFALAAAYVFSLRFSRPNSRSLQVAALLLVCTIAPLVLQPDIGQTLLLVAVWISLVFLAGYPLWIFGGLFSLFLGGATAAYFSFSHVRVRVDAFLFHDIVPTSQVGIAIRAFRNGGLFGRGASEGELNSSLADSYADFVFAAVGEEFGFFVCAVLLMLFLMMVWRSLGRVLQEDEPFAFLAVSGLIILFGLQSLMNMTVNLGLIPPTGIILPFVSYGGSGMLGMSVLMGLVLALTRRNGRPLPVSVVYQRRPK